MIWSNRLLILHQSNVKFKIMGLLDFLFGAAIMNSASNHHKNNRSQSSGYNNSYERGYEDGYEDGCYDHDCEDSAEHDDYYSDSCEHDDYSYGGDDCDCGCDDCGDW